MAQGGLGLRVEVTAGYAAQARPGSQAFLHTSLVVREDSLTLFGFAEAEELEMFGLLTGVTGVGPRSALGVLSAVDPARIVAAVTAEDDKPFRAASGIGPKTAKQIVLSLTGKLGHLTHLSEAQAPALPAADLVGADVVTALAGLGYPEQQAVDAVQAARDAGAAAEQGPLLRAALALLQAPRGGGRP